MRWPDFITCWLLSTVIFLAIPNNKVLMMFTCAIAGILFGVYRAKNPWEKKDDK